MHRYFYLLFVSLSISASAQPFTFYFQRSDLANVHFGNALWGDYDNDGDFDVLLIGASLNGGIARLYRYDGVEHRLVSLETREYASYEIVQSFDVGGWYGNGAWGDYDGDGDLDVVLLGARNEDVPYAPSTKIYRNDGNRFTDLNAGIPGLFAGSASWGDYDNDGDLDLLLTGAKNENDSQYLTAIYRNDDGRFIDTRTSLPGIFCGNGTWGDYDNDGDLDILLTGATKTYHLTRIYRNDDETFSDIQEPFARMAFSTGHWGDYDSDGDFDILLTGAQFSPHVMDGITKVYANDDGSFIDLNVGLPGVFYGGSSWGDYNSDGNLDILLIGKNEPFGRHIGRVYMSEDHDFVYKANLPGTFMGTTSVGDHNGDGDLDLLTIGSDQVLVPRTSLFTNEQRNVNQRPLPPTGLQVTTNANRITLGWDAATDVETAVAGLTYNLRVGTTPRGSEIMSPLADPSNGRRTISASGNAGSNTQWTLKNLHVGTYYWGVQALDNSYLASVFSEEQSFEVTSTGTIETNTAENNSLPAQYSLSQNYPNPFSEITTINYDLPHSANVSLNVYSVLGREVRTLVRRTQSAGRKTVTWNGTDNIGRRLSPGVYFYRLHIDERALSKKLIIMK